MPRIALRYRPKMGHTVHFVPSESGTASDGMILLSPECRGIGEVREAAERLKRDIDRAVSEAETIFARRRPTLDEEEAYYRDGHDRGLGDPI